MAGHGSAPPPDRARHPNRQVGRELFTAIDKNGVEDKEVPSVAVTGKHTATDYAYWMNSANPGSHYQVRH